MLSYFYLFLASFFMGVFSFSILRKISLKLNLVNKEKKIPFTGGLGIYLSFSLCFLIFILSTKVSLPFHILWIFSFSLILLLIEFIDDIKDFSLKTKIIIQIIFVILRLTMVHED